MDWLSSDDGLLVLGTLISGAWALFRSQDWYERVRTWRADRALMALEAGIDRAYEEYVRAIKAARADGKLTSEERRRARDLAVHAAVEYGRNEGVDIMTELGVSYIDAWINRLLRARKR